MENQPFVSMPSFKTKERTEHNEPVYKDVCNPITSEFRKDLYDDILSLYGEMEQSGKTEVSRVAENAGEPEFRVADSAYVTGPISAILNIGYLLSGIIPSTKRYYEFMDLQEELDNGKIVKPPFGDLTLENVFFSYEVDKPILIDVNLKFPMGSKTALIGRNGSGKTTIINLLTRLHEPVNGRILLNGTDITKISLQAYRNMVSVVSQQIFLFNDTIRNNICLYKQVSDEEIKAACMDSSLDDFLEEASLEYVVGQNGAMLSGGQKQKIALARALVHDKPIIIFDEATSNTDVYSEHQINSLLHTRLKDKTVVVITHKKEILNEVDEIIMLKDGVVVETGCYKELLSSSLEFKNMIDMDK